MKKATLILIAFILGILGSADNALAQKSDTISYNPNRTSFKTFIPGIIAISYGAVALNDGILKKLDYNIYERRNNKRPNFHTYLDDYLRYSSFISLYGLEVLGFKGKHNLKEKTTLVLITGGIAYTSLSILKNITNKQRPNQSDYRSFPSGHATIAFTGAELLNQEYGDISPWYSIAGYTVASTTSILRVYNNEHWFSDVVTGAGVGILSTKLTYVMYPYIKKLVLPDHKDFKLTAVPFYSKQATGFSVYAIF
jgi:membrane-associated phospholipid phosphatase